VENRLVAVTGQQLELAAVEVADKVDRLMVERYGDILMLARALGPHVSNLHYLDEHLIWTKEAHAPVYLWLAVADPKGRIVASTKPSLVGQARGDAAWFQTAKNHRTVSVDDVALHDPEDGIETIAHSAPILSPKGEVLGVVTSRISIRMIEEIVTGTIQALARRNTRCSRKTAGSSWTRTVDVRIPRTRGLATDPWPIIALPRGPGTSKRSMRTDRFLW
jgi:predicted dienelactone hydrolase